MVNDGDKFFSQKCVRDDEGKGRDIEHVVDNHDGKQSNHNNDDTGRSSAQVAKLPVIKRKQMGFLGKLPLCNLLKCGISYQ